MKLISMTVCASLISLIAITDVALAGRFVTSDGVIKALGVVNSPIFEPLIQKLLTEPALRRIYEERLDTWGFDYDNLVSEVRKVTDDSTIEDAGKFIDVLNEFVYDRTIDFERTRPLTEIEAKVFKPNNIAEISRTDFEGEPLTANLLLQKPGEGEVFVVGIVKQNERGPELVTFGQIALLAKEIADTVPLNNLDDDLNEDQVRELNALVKSLKSTEANEVRNPEVGNPKISDISISFEDLTKLLYRNGIQYDPPERVTATREKLDVTPNPMEPHPITVNVKVDADGNESISGPQIVKVLDQIKELVGTEEMTLMLNTSLEPEEADVVLSEVRNEEVQRRGRETDTDSETK